MNNARENYEMDKVALQGVEDTLFIPLMARAYFSKVFPEYFYDEKVIEIEKQLPPNFVTEKSSEYTMMGSASRALVMDNIVKNYVDKQGASNIVCIGCGLETMAWRLADYNQYIHFYEIDFDTVIEQREGILGKCENETLISGNVNHLDLSEYMDVVKPTLFVVAGVFHYFKEQEVLRLIEKLKSEFKNSEMVFDAVSDMGLKYVNRYVKKTGNLDAQMYFAVNNGQEFAKLTNTELIEECGFYQNVTKDFKKKLKLYTKFSMFFNDYKKTSTILHLGLYNTKGKK